ncbi:DNA mismatch repair protein [Rhexocercosporidium sp. MPI-PUGE-AT-0058]|nr:DNA mismatch repair protein [Rhexocercosporidium sp. MPI-PUGE-AT-0058]
MSIQPLPPSVVAQIKSSITITSLNGVVCELLKNSLDAEATKIDISVDYSRGSCSVEDDGLGILPSEFGVEGHLGKLYHSSKLDPRIEVHGGRGEFLASLSALALVSITSSHHLHRSHNSLTLHKSEVASRQTPAPLRQYFVSQHGTQVTVGDLFGNIPVRVKQRALISEKEGGNSKDWEVLRRDLVALLLPWRRTVAVTIRDTRTNQQMNVRPASMPFQSGKVSVTSVCSILAQGSFISHEEKKSWISIHASTPNLDISGTISLDPTATKHVQFICLGIQPITSWGGQSILHDEINRLFVNSAFGNQEQEGEIDSAEQDRRVRDGRYKGDTYTNKELKGIKKGVDRWPMFFIKIQHPDLATSKSQVQDVLDEKGRGLLSILELLRVMIFEFLTKHHFRPKINNNRQPKKVIDVGQPAVSSSPTTRKSPIRPQTKDQTHAKPNKSSLERKHRLDPLGTNIRLPSFRQGSSAAEYPFDSWSRVKKGAPSRPTTPKLPLKELRDPQISRPATAPPSFTNFPSTNGTSATRMPRLQPLLSKDGKLVRAPFSDVSPHTKPLSLPVPLPPEAPNSGMVLEDADKVVTWINPVTKIQSFVNKHNGITMQSTNAPFQQSRLTTFGPDQPAPQSTPCPWIADVLKKWDNPVFALPEPSIPRILFDGPGADTQHILHGHHHHCSQIDIDRAFTGSSSGINGRISKDALGRAEVVSQLDQKFILVKLQSTRVSGSEPAGGSILVLIDQHAADERIRVEALIEELCSTPASNSTTSSGILTSSLAKPLQFDLSAKEIELLQIHESHFTNWGILYSISPPTSAPSVRRFTVHSLPPAILERCQSSPRLLIDLIRTEVWKAHDKHPTPAPPLPLGDWPQRVQTCPQGILDMVNSRACRSAIMFNDVLSNEQCTILVNRLAVCKFPFQCAHGRPSLVPLVELSALNLGTRMEPRGQGVGFTGQFRKWKEGMD